MSTINTIRTAIAAPQALSNAGSAVDPALKKAAQAFEAVFLRQMMASMRQAGLGDELFGNQATEQFREMADAKTADTMAERGALGVADMLLKQFEGLAKLQAAQPAATASGTADKTA